jgi:hypothetical protein
MDSFARKGRKINEKYEIQRKDYRMGCLNPLFTKNLGS